MYARGISPSGLEFQPGTRQASSPVEIPTPRVRFPYPTWTLMVDCYYLIGKDWCKKKEYGFAVVSLNITLSKVRVRDHTASKLYVYSHKYNKTGSNEYCRVTGILGL